MQAKLSSQTWAGALRFVPLIQATILLFSIITLGLAATYGKQLAEAPLDSYYIAFPEGAIRRSNSYFVFYSGTMPVLTILQSAADLILFFTIGLNPVFALTVSILFLCGWAVQVSFWADCDISGSWTLSAYGTCYQSNLQQVPPGGFAVVGVTTGLGNTKVAFGFFLLVLYVTYMSFSAAAVHKRRIQQKAPMVGMQELESSEQETTDL